MFQRFIYVILNLNLDLEVKTRRIRKIEDEALENSRKPEEMRAENLELKQKLVKESEYTRVDAQTLKSINEKLETQLIQAESEFRQISLGMSNC